MRRLPFLFLILLLALTVAAAPALANSSVAKTPEGTLPAPAFSTAQVERLIDLIDGPMGHDEAIPPSVKPLLNTAPARASTASPCTTSTSAATR
ncbi:MAG: hypothetical protein WDO13_08580 [Verrucomicrobiota bacterium]